MLARLKAPDCAATERERGIPCQSGIMPDDTSPWAFDDDEDDEDDEFLADWDQADLAAAQLLREACGSILSAPPPQPELSDAASYLRRGVEEGRWPFGYFVQACGWRRTRPENDDELWMVAARSTISPPDDPGTPPEEQSAVMSLMHADWFGMVVGLVRRGPGATFDGPAALRDITAAPEIGDESDDIEGDRYALDFAATVLTPLWTALGILDDNARVTRLGVWGLPHALYLEWTASATPGESD